MLNAGPALAHDPKHPELDHWFSTLYSGKGPCCSGNDFVVLRDDEWDYGKDHYRVFLEGLWMEVPEDAVIRTGGNPYGQAIVWPFKTGGPRLVIRCFLPGAGI